MPSSSASSSPAEEALATTWALNAIISAVSFSVALLGALLPRWLFPPAKHLESDSSSRYPLGLSIGNMLSAGVMMSAALVHLLAESFATMTEAAGGDDPFPWAMVLCGLGFIITLLTAQLLEPGSGESRCMECIDGCKLNQSLKVSPAAAILTKGVSGNFEHHIWHDLVLDHSRCTHHIVLAPENGEPAAHYAHGHSTTPAPPPQLHHRASNECGCSAHSSLGQPLLLPAMEEGADAITEELPSAERLPPFGDFRGSAPQPVDPHHAVGSFVLAVGLALHSCIEGAAIGAQQSEGDILHVAVAVMAHKGLTAYAVGSSLLISRATPTQYVSYLALFTMSTPVGILTGALLSTSLNGMWAVGMSAVASGTFLYSAVLEVLGNELRLDCYSMDSVHRTYCAKMCKLASFIVGFVLMTLVSKLE